MNRLVRAVGGLAVEVVAIAREAILIPLRLWMSVAERAGAVTLAGWRLAYPRLVGLARALVLAVQIGERIATPARAAAVTGAAACVVLVISQFVHYRGVQIGTPEYRAVSSVAPPPQVDLRVPTDEHGIWLFVAAAAAAVIIVLALQGRWRLGRLLVVPGAAVLLVSFAVDAPAGLDEGRAGLAYQGAHAVLLGGFWAQVAAGAVLLALGPLLSRYVRGEQETSARARRRSPRPAVARGASP